MEAAKDFWRRVIHRSDQVFVVFNEDIPLGLALEAPPRSNVAELEAAILGGHQRDDRVMMQYQLR